MSADSAASYIAAAIPADSVEHFVLQMTPAAQKKTYATAVALGRVIRNIIGPGGETSIQQLKLSWWLEEARLISEDKPRHPLSLALHEQIGHATWVGVLTELVTDTSADVGLDNFPDLQSCLRFCHHAAQCQALTASCLPHSEQTLDNARTMGVGICLTELIQQPQQANNRLRRPGLGGAVADLNIEQLAKLALQHFAASEATADPSCSDSPAVYLQGRLYELLLKRLLKNNFDAAAAQPHALVLLWQAWREARRLTR